jgi:hypothetical protein
MATVVVRDGVKGSTYRVVWHDPHLRKQTDGKVR